MFRGKSSNHKLNYSLDNPINSPEDFVEFLDLGTDYTFTRRSSVTLDGKELSRFNQYYQGIEVEPGGFAFIGTDPCNTLISAYVYSGIPDITNPNVIEEDLKDILEGEITKTDLVLSIDPSNECELQQLWRVEFFNDGHKLAWVNSYNGSIVRSRSFGDNLVFSSERNALAKVKNALGRVDVVDVVDEDDGVLIYSFKDCDDRGAEANTVEEFTNSETLELLCTFEDENLQTLNDNFASILDCFEVLDIEFPTAYVLTGCAFSDPASAFFTEWDDGILFGFGFEPEGLITQNYQEFYSTDVIAHEFGHHFLNQFFRSSISNNHAVIHEYFSDLFSLYTNTVGCGNENDFQGNTLSGGVIRDFQDFDFNDPCRYNVDSSFDTDNPHFYGAPFRYLAFSIIDNELLSLEEFFELTVEILSTFPDDGTVVDLAQLYIDEFGERFGECGEETSLIKQLVRDLCLNNNNFACGIEISVNSSGINTTGNSTIPICENVDNGRVSIFLDDNNYDPDAVLSWKGLKTDWIVNGQTNNTSPTNRYLTIQFPSYDFYDRRYTICARTPVSGREGCFDILLTDCDNNDPECEDLFEIEGNFNNQAVSDRSYPLPIGSSNQFELFDMTGKFIVKGGLDVILDRMQALPFQVYVAKEFDESGSVLKVYKLVQ